MTNAQLIEILKKLPPDAPVMVDGYEGGLVDLEEAQVRQSSVWLDVRTSGYEGPHEKAEDWCSWYGEEDEEGKSPTKVTAVILASY